MSGNQMTQAYPAATGPSADFDAIVVGAGFAGLYMLHSLRTLGLSVRVDEQGGGVGGTWYWNRYPGARCDSESVYYMFSDHMSEEILGEWNWSERYAAQPEILRYLEFVADKMDLRPGYPVQRESNFRGLRLRTQLLGSPAGRRQHVIGTIPGHRGRLPVVDEHPEIPGIDAFAGGSYHTGAWPHEGVDFTGQRVAVRHRCHGGPGRPGDRQAGGARLGLPADSEL